MNEKYSDCIEKVSQILFETIVKREENLLDLAVQSFFRNKKFSIVVYTNRCAFYFLILSEFQ